ncbi:MAG: stage III sporulation protein AD [Lachnospiraceae bacterium]|uniref:stage III sporulation AC/AD family protein n=1 Tax=Roseburia sp. 1XD42-69 TaxID=2320088 RepID=UPI000EA17931|nr:stage III sporulation AC/AD family protein [Roseburia sp. 1XD42-69]MCI8874636.1 stage III sporulation protein AD [Lachnospiraceae bacterium]MCX4318298.1 stage III sporulation AC/AD family protein [Lachnospiraceae bacterium]RKJ66595.1 stage III sporulation protein AD [Roseburia sp. 1XD42-69]
MDIIKISILGITAVLLSQMLKNYKPEYGYYINLAVCICVFLYVMSKLTFLLDYVEQIQDMIHLDPVYLTMILKMIGITYVAEFAVNLCKDAGCQTIAGQIELFAKLSILVISMPVILAFMETIGELL